MIKSVQNYHSELFCTVRQPCWSTKMAAAVHRFT